MATQLLAYVHIRDEPAGAWHRHRRAFPLELPAGTALDDEDALFSAVPEILQPWKDELLRARGWKCVRCGKASVATAVRVSWAAGDDTKADGPPAAEKDADGVKDTNGEKDVEKVPTVAWAEWLFPVCGYQGSPCWPFAQEKASTFKPAGAEILDSKRMCAACRKTTSDLAGFQRCSRCRSTYYCSQACQRGHWAQHKEWCHAPP
ncbi:hypothetical protein DFJ74DRAFT_691617 [Hyaloraphidium curvatum]|nr:hypothetical protein DFJ74DRAFT_691617 [Hyaloraphidium curvatum]